MLLPPPPADELTPHRKPAGRPELDGSIVTQALPVTSSWDPVEAMRTSIDTFEEKMDELLMLLRSSQSPPSAPVEDVLLSPCSTVTELQELDRSLSQQERRNKTQLFLTTFGGSTGGTAIRLMLQQVATNDIKPYSLQGRKTKKAFQDLTICRVITAASQKNFPVRVLGSIISQDLKWESNILKKAQQRMYFLRQLRKHGLPQELLAIFYTAAILLPRPLWQALQIPAHKNNQTQEQLLSTAITLLNC